MTAADERGPVIEVLLSNGDRAEALTPEGAELAARTLLNEYVLATGASRRLIDITYMVDGTVVGTVTGRSI